MESWATRKWNDLYDRHGYSRFAEREGKTYFVALVLNGSSFTLTVNSVQDGLKNPLFLGIVPGEYAKSTANALLREAGYK